MAEIKRVAARHGVVCALPGREDGYFGWPSVARLDSGRLVAGGSGLRRHHIDPCGKTVLCFGDESGGFGPCEVVNDSPLDDRDVGVVALPGGGLLVSWFTLDSRIFRDSLQAQYPSDEFMRMDAAMSAYDESAAVNYRGAWTMVSPDGGKTWNKPVRCPVSAPHGPTVLRDGTLLYLGKQFHGGMDRPFGNVACAVSKDGSEWREIGEVALPYGVELGQFHEPHVIELPSGELLGVIRYHYPAEQGGSLGIYQTESSDGGKTWSVPHDLDMHGSPPHLLRHSSGAIVITYGWRHPGYGQRARVSNDGGNTWGDELILRDDGPDGDLGYPCSVELSDGDIFTVYYQKRPGDALPSILWTRWNIDT